MTTSLTTAELQSLDAALDRAYFSGLTEITQAGVRLVFRSEAEYLRIKERLSGLLATTEVSTVLGSRTIRTQVNCG